MSRQDAATLAGVTPRTVQNWMSWAEEEIERVASNPRASIRKDKRDFVDFYYKYLTAEAEHRQTLTNSVNITTMGYLLKEETTTKIYRNGQLYQEVKTEKEKEVGPDGNLAMRMLDRGAARQYQEDGEKPEADPRMEMLGRILRMSKDELEALNDNLEAAL
jgi:hypothetical protein